MPVNTKSEENPYQESGSVFLPLLLCLALSLSFVPLISSQAGWMLWSLRAEGITHPQMSFQSCGVPLSTSPSLSCVTVSWRSSEAGVEQHVFTRTIPMILCLLAVKCSIKMTRWFRERRPQPPVMTTKFSLCLSALVCGNGFVCGPSSSPLLLLAQMERSSVHWCREAPIWSFSVFVERRTDWNDVWEGKHH